MKQQIFEPGIAYSKIPITFDDTSAINIAKNPTKHSRTKHIDVRHHFIKDHIQKDDIIPEFEISKGQMANILNKAKPWEL